MDVINDLLLNPSFYVAPLVTGGVMAFAGAAWLRAGRRHAGLIEERVKRYGVTASKYQLVSGLTSKYYHDADLFLGTPANIDLVLKWLEDVIDAEQAEHGPLHRLVFIERRDGPVGGATLKDLVSWKTWIPAVVVRPERKGPAPKIKGTEAELLVDKPREGRPKGVTTLYRGSVAEHVLLINDVATTGTTLLQAVELVRKAGGHLQTAVVLFDRDEGASGRLAKVGVRLVAFAVKGKDASETSVQAA